MTRDELYALIADHIAVTDEWGGEKIANWKYGFNLCVAGIDEATDAILAKLEMEFEDANAKLRVSLRAHQKITQQFDLTDCIKISEAALLVTDYDFDANGVLLEHR